MDYTLSTYKTLLVTLKRKDFSFLAFESYLQHKNNSIIIVRHDVDRLPQNSLKLAQLEHSLGIKGTYYFRVVPESYDFDIMNKVANLGHEIGYHYEDVDLVMKNYKLKIKNDYEKEELIDLAFESFCKYLEMFRKNFDIKTICMHGSPRSKYDNKLIWQKYNYKDLGLIGEPYYDIDFNEFAYFTDTGRRWNGHKVSVRDKVNCKYNFDYKTTQQIIDNIEKLPNKIMFTIHPERWHACPVKWSDFIFHGNKTLPWLKELVFQNSKNLVKRFLISIR